MVTLYTSDTCAYCMMVKKYLKYKNIDYEEVNITKYPERIREIINTTGLTTVPVVRKTEGDKTKTVVGYNLPQLSKLFDK